MWFLFFWGLLIIRHSFCLLFYFFQEKMVVKIAVRQFEAFPYKRHTRNFNLCLFRSYDQLEKETNQRPERHSLYQTNVNEENEEKKTHFVHLDKQLCMVYLMTVPSLKYRLSWSKHSILFSSPSEGNCPQASFLSFSERDSSALNVFSVRWRARIIHSQDWACNCMTWLQTHES